MERRAIILAGAATVFSTAIASAAESSRPSETFYASARMRGRGTTGPGLWWYKGTAFGQKAGEPQEALLGVEGCSFNRLIANPDGTPSQHMSETGYSTDLATGAILDSWVNPFNGRTVKPGHYHTQQRVLATIDSLRSEESGRPRGGDQRTYRPPCCRRGHDLGHRELLDQDHAAQGRE